MTLRTLWVERCRSLCPGCAMSRPSHLRLPGPVCLWLACDLQQAPAPLTPQRWEEQVGQCFELLLSLAFVRGAFWHSRSGPIPGRSLSAGGQLRPGGCSGRVDVLASPPPIPATSGSSFIPEGSVSSASCGCSLQRSQAPREVGATALPHWGWPGFALTTQQWLGPCYSLGLSFPVGLPADTDELTPQMPPGHSPRHQWPNNSCVKYQLKESFFAFSNSPGIPGDWKGSDSGPQPPGGKGASCLSGGCAQLFSRPSSAQPPRKLRAAGLAPRYFWLQISPAPSPRQVGPNQTYSRQVGLGFCLPPGRQGWVGWLGPVSAVPPGPGRAGLGRALVLTSRLHSSAGLCSHKQRSQPISWMEKVDVEV
nr:uncharacterized protein LOC105734182 [Aotus nancymaae]